MVEHKLKIVEWLNTFVVWLLSLVGVEIEKGKEVIPAHIVLVFLVVGLLILFFKLTVKNLSLFPGKMQYFLESIYKFFLALIDDIIGKEGRKFIPALGTIGLFILVSNLLGLFPELESPTAKLNVTAGCALFIFSYYHMVGIKKHGVIGYLKTFAGPAWWLAWLFFPIEVISHFSRPLSLSLRLFGNIFGEDYVIIIIASLLPFIAPIPMMAFAIFTAALQAFIFVMLSSIYLAGAVSEEH